MNRLILTALLLTFLVSVVPAGDAPKYPEVAVRQPVTRDVIEYEFFKGNIEAGLKREVQPRVNGFLDKILFRDGQDVKQGDNLFELDSRVAKFALEKALLELQARRAALDRWNADVQRAQQLLTKSAISRDEFERMARFRDEAEIAVKSAEVDVQRMRWDVDATVIHAPISGRIGRALVTPGNLVTAGTTLATVIALDPLHINVEVPDELLVRFRLLAAKEPLKWPVKVALAGGDTFTPSQVVFVDNKADARTRTVQLQTLLPNKDQSALPGMVGGVQIPIPTRKVLTVPKTALPKLEKPDAKLSFVFVVGENNILRLQPVTLGAIMGEERAIETGLTATDLVVVDVQNARPLLKVIPKKEK